MPHNCFLSVVCLIEEGDSSDDVAKFALACGQSLSRDFTDYELIFVDNQSSLDWDMLDLDESTRKNCHVVKLAAYQTWDLAIFAGLERANGDYTGIFDLALVNLVDLFSDLYNCAQEGNDISYLCFDHGGAIAPLRRSVFYALLNAGGRLRVDPLSSGEFLISRRALNWILRHRSRTGFLKEALFGSGYTHKGLRLQGVGYAKRRRARDASRIAWGALARATTFPLTVGKWAIGLMTLTCAAAVANAVIVRFFEHNIFGQPEEYVPGWAFVVILVSVGLLITNLMTYALLRLLYVVLDEIRTEPRYIVERYFRL